MEVFIKKQLFYSPIVFLEKTLPKEGEIVVKVGDLVAPFDVLGHTYISLTRRRLALPKGTKLLVQDGELIGVGQILAKKSKFIGGQVFTAPFSGLVKIEEDGRALEISSSPERFNLVSGISARVAKIISNLSLLLETSATLVQGVWAVGPEIVGEIRFLEEPPGGSLTKGLGPESVGKIIVYPGFVNDAFLQKAKTLGVTGVVCGAVESRLEESWLTVLVTEGFGKAEMPRKLAQSLKQASLKTAVISPARNQLILPDYPDSGLSLKDRFTLRREAKVGDLIQILNWPYFSEEAVVEQLLGPTLFESHITEEALLVRRVKKGELVKIPAANVVIID